MRNSHRRQGRFFGTTGDLVVAKTDGDGLLWLERVLCRDDHSYSTRANDYQKGVFYKNTGQILDHDRKPKGTWSDAGFGEL